ncbi:Sensory subunit of low CO2-induced protein complex, putative [Methanosarcina lacustris Z-7289]|uniref:Sensory subunit of low CO2-induced protein complex, putative n=1 Tax=Methanosarcina lacustris Z-7289 TaxID=1434111 RepID=A0A0E3S8H5_9EURY|nr:Sensory subunit of low CO2-induced protein complex, putative [Methanosarcina lacustris Z-7289]
MLFSSGCSQKAPENETQKIENESENLTKEAENVPQEIENVIEKSDRNIVQTLADKNFVTLVELINVSGLETTLAEDGIYTVFAPTDKAFAELPDYAVPALKNNTQGLKKVLTYHVTGKVLMKKDLEKMTAIKTLEGGNSLSM